MRDLGDGVTGFSTRPQVAGVLSTRSPQPPMIENLGELSRLCAGRIIALMAALGIAIAIVLRRQKRATFH